MPNIIRALRKEKGLTQKQVAEYLNVDRSTYAYYEGGRLKNIDVLLRLSELFEVNLYTLIGKEIPDFKS